MTIISKLLSPSSRPRARRTPEKRVETSTYQAVAEAVGSLNRSQATSPRFYWQWIASFLAVAIILGIIASLYLNVSAQTIIAGREIQEMQFAMEKNKYDNADLQTEIATQLASEKLAERAKDAGFVPLKAEDLEYIIVPGYFPKSGLNMEIPVTAEKEDSLSPLYTENLFEWMGRQIENASLPLVQEQP